LSRQDAERQYQRKRKEGHSGAQAAALMNGSHIELLDVLDSEDWTLERGKLCLRGGRERKPNLRAGWKTYMLEPVSPPAAATAGRDSRAFLSNS
jgi:hypothetical protein